MRVGVLAIGIGSGARPEMIRAIAESSERVGFATIWAPEHVVLFDSHESKYPYAETGKFPLGGETPWLDPFITLTWAAAFTKRIRLATGICLVPEHNPVILAKEIASLDYLSGGRFALGVGIGWLAEEFAALGIPFERRAQRAREYIQVMRRLWGESNTTFAGEFVRLKEARTYPKPRQGAKLPVIFGGESTPALKRVAEYGNGWFGFNLDPGGAAEKIRQLRALLKQSGRAADEVEIIVSPYTQSVSAADLARYHEAGVQEIALVTNLPEDAAQIAPRIETLAREWLEPAGRLK